MKTFVFDVTRRVVVTLDESKFTTKTMAEFNSVITDLGTDEHAYLAHAERIADLFAHGLEDFNPSDFVEGYGPIEAAGIFVKADDDYDYIERVFPEGGAA
ncbi:hypothetical protein [Agrobacterium tumefaciens]|uniref:hypothetical protein n=1 Tax=Agrobacterium tumefaciens TaxID=358 RepID=UPI00080FA4B5|nr:hypothetical protein [Agrobacterium tumefaciens]NSL22398.1 hypothetical protein [Agrobacterium tumefaciens]NTC57215.1 hypothetical protein [Agrobacterium tumefaciens]NTC62131.1 hypothetical protein [Agrobacterium tumefaciens]NTC65861.1 hypothetical protein [Agrobacterium tumefaciens]NTC74441.1 hypothetical protein [Agrobacterium tumefaciens]